MDIFGRDGNYLYKTKLPFAPDLIGSGYIFDIFVSEETGETMIKRYKVKNWSNISSFKGN